VVDLSAIRCLKPENWSYATPSERKDALQEIERQCAAGDNRAERTINYFREPAGKHGYYKIDDPMSIHINESDLELSTPHEVVNTVAHEGRHAYQHDCITDSANHPEISDHRRNKWSYSLNCPVIANPNDSDYEETFEIYFNQPTEVDAREYAHSLCSQLADQQDFLISSDTSIERQTHSVQALGTIPPESICKNVSTNPNSLDKLGAEIERDRPDGGPSLSAERLELLQQGAIAMPPSSHPAPEPSATPRAGKRH
jgi:hypothetical protein